MKDSLGKAIERIHHKLVDAEAAATNTSKDHKQQTEDTELEQNKQNFAIGKAAHDYDRNLRILSGGISNPTDQELKDAQAGKEWYENYIKIAYENAAKAGASKDVVDKYSQQCKEVFEEWLRNGLKNLQTVMHSDGTMTVTNTRTGESAKFSNDGNPIE